MLHPHIEYLGLGEQRITWALQTDGQSTSTHVHQGDKLGFLFLAPSFFNYVTIKYELFSCWMGIVFRHWFTCTASSDDISSPTATQRVYFSLSKFCPHSFNVHGPNIKHRLVLQSVSQQVVGQAGSCRQVGWLSHTLAALRQPLCCPSDKLDLPACFAGGGVLVGLELGVVVRELVIQDWDGHAVEDDAKGDTCQSQDAAQVGLREHVTVANSGNAHLNQRGAQRLASKQHYRVEFIS